MKTVIQSDPVTIYEVGIEENEIELEDIRDLKCIAIRRGYSTTSVPFIRKDRREKIGNASITLHNKDMLLF